MSVLDTMQKEKEKEYRSAFFKSLLGHKLTEFEQAAYDRAMGDQRADTFADSTSAAAVLPTQTLNEVVKKARTMGGLMSVCRAFNIPSKVAVPIGTPTEAASWHAEGAAVESGKPDVTSVSFEGYEIMKVFSISEKARKMSVSAFEGYMTQELNASVMECIANALVNGTGKAQGTGILTGITWEDGKNALTFSKTAGLKYADVVKVVSALKRGYANGAAWAMNKLVLIDTPLKECLEHIRNDPQRNRSRRKFERLAIEWHEKYNQSLKNPFIAPHQTD